MHSRMFVATTLTSLLLTLACEGPPADAPLAPQVLVSPAADLSGASGGGQYLVTLGEDELPGTFSFTANRLPNGASTGQLRYTIDFFGEHVEFHGTVTCLTVDSGEGRAWIGGVVTKNLSVAEPFAGGEIFQPGRDIWFRVLDSGEGRDLVDRTTFVGFEGGAGIITSQEYCDLAPWPDENARTWPVVSGNVRAR